MAEAILSPLLDIIFGHLASIAMQELQMVWGVDEELENLKSTFSTIQAVLADAEEKQFDSEAIRDWLQKLKHVAYDADDVVDEMAAEAQQSKTAECGTEAGHKKKKQQQILNTVLSCFNCSRIPHRREMAIRIRAINVQLKKIAEERRDYHLAEERRDYHLETGGGSKKVEIRREQRQPVGSVMDQSSQVVGREDDKEQIIRYLLSNDSGGRTYSVVAIVGMGGVGKTTLAQVVYNEQRITESFELTAWVCVSEHFDMKRLTKEIIVSASKSPCDLPDIDSLQCCLRDKLNGKKFLLVLDDVWSENDSDWEGLQAPFTFGAKGSKIVVTTRSHAVSNAMEATCTHNLKCLSKQDSWSLFVGQAFKDENMDAYPDLLKVGEELVAKSGGLPLAAKALGGLLSHRRDVREWENVLKSPIWELQGSARKILPALRLSYRYLPAHLKRCFTFCAVFPKDYELRKQRLVQFWVAHGFIRHEEGKQIEDTGSEYFDDLFLRSFFQTSRFDESEELFAYKMHDLFHDLAQFISGDECFQMEQGKAPGVLRKTRHFSHAFGYRGPINFEPFYELKGLRTFLLHRQPFRHVNVTVPREMFERLIFIRVLDFRWAKITELPNTIGNLKHLRYLNLEFTMIKELPESICSIYNMQTLLLRLCPDLVELPNEMRKLINLRHLDLEGCGIVSMPPQIGRLTYLQTLPLFVVGGEREIGISQLKELTDIRGSLRIEKLEKVADAEEVGQANLKNKSFIDRLDLVWSGDHDQSLQNERLEEQVAKELQPPPKLKRLLFSGYMGAHFPSWVMKMDVLLSNLEALDLTDCSRCSILPPLGRLPSLSSIRVNGMSEIKQIGHELSGVAGGFPSLKELKLVNMFNLEHWQECEEDGAFPCLQKLFVLHCNQLRQLPCNPIANITYLQIDYCASLVSLPRLPSLKELILRELASLEEWSDDREAHFPHLRRLSIHNCPKMTRWPTMLPVLTELTVSYCQGFDALPPLPSLCQLSLTAVNDRLLKSVHFLTSLSSLDIRRIPNLISFPRGMLQALTQLKDLNVWHCEKLETLLEENGLQDEGLPSTLTQLSFNDCPSLKSLPRQLRVLTSLHALTINSCRYVTSLPEEGLPSALQRLYIGECPDLKERCRKDGGEDWPKISHIPDVKLDLAF